MNTQPAENSKPSYSIISDGGAGRCWKVEYHGITDRSEALTLADSNLQQHGGQWIVAEDWKA